MNLKNHFFKSKDNLNRIIIPETICIILIVIIVIFFFALVHSSFLKSYYSRYFIKEEKENNLPINIEMVIDNEKIRSELENGLAPEGKSTIFGKQN